MVLQRATTAEMRELDARLLALLPEEDAQRQDLGAADRALSAAVDRGVAGGVADRSSSAGPAESLGGLLRPI